MINMQKVVQKNRGEPSNSAREFQEGSGENAAILEFSKIVEISQAENMAGGSRKRGSRHRMLGGLSDHGIFQELQLIQYDYWMLYRTG